jgi:LacI family transcriptional regulator
MPDEQIREVAERRPVVLVNRDTAGLCRVLIDTAAGIEEAVGHLADLGHTSLVYVSGPAASWSDQQRRSAVRKATRRHKLELTSVAASRPTFESGRSVAAAVLATGATAALTFDDLVAHGLLARLLEMGVRVPEEISVIGCDDVLGASTYPALTSVSARCDEAGKIAVELLMSILNSGRNSEARSVLETRLVVRATTAPAPARSIRVRKRISA